MWCLRRAPLALALLAAVLLAYGCGYRLKGREPVLPEDVQSIAIPVLENLSNEPGLETDAARILIDEFNRRQALRVVSEAEADAVLKGVLARVYTSPLAYTSGLHASERRVALWADFQVLRTGTEELLWDMSNMSFQEGYMVDQEDPVSTDAARREALRKILRNLAEKVHEHLFTAF